MDIKRQNVAYYILRNGFHSSLYNFVYQKFNYMVKYTGRTNLFMIGLIIDRSLEEELGK